MTRTLWLFFLLSLSGFLPAQAQTLPRCFERPTYLGNPWVNPTRWCLEQVYQAQQGQALEYTALAVDDAGALYAASPLNGTITRFDDSNADGLPDQPTVILEDLTRPNGLTFHDDALYISGGPNIYRWRAGELETLVDSLPDDSGFWTGGIAVDDERIYVGIGAGGAASDRERGAVWSFTLDGSDRRIEATGLRHPADLALLDGQLWAVDSVPQDFADGYDELNLIEPGGFYGWPACIDNCSGLIDPAVIFPVGSTPVGLVAYNGEAFSEIAPSLIVVMAGSNNAALMEGYTVAVVSLDENGNVGQPDVIIPDQDPVDGQQFSTQAMNYRTSGFWPRRPLDAAVSPEGWIYISAGNGQLLALRPH